MTFKKEYFVEESHAAAVVGSGGLPVLGTPMLVAYMENAAFEYCRRLTADDETTVGSEFSIKHLAPTALKDKVTVTIKEVTQEKRLIHFTLEAHDSKHLIGQATHTRVLVMAEKFMSKI